MSINYYVQIDSFRSDPASAVCRKDCGIFNKGLSCFVFVTNTAHLVNTLPIHFGGLPLLDTCCCSCFGVTQEHWINKSHEELMRQGKERILAVGTLTSGWRFLGLPTYESIARLWWLLSLQIVTHSYSVVYNLDELLNNQVKGWHDWSVELQLEFSSKGLSRTVDFCIGINWL